MNALPMIDDRISFWTVLILIIVLGVIGELVARGRVRRRSQPPTGPITVPADFKGRATVHVQVRRANGRLEKPETITQVFT